MAHITGGGLPENLPRCLGPDQSIHLDLGSWPVPPVFTWLATTGQVPEVDLYHTFNMGLGFALVVPPEAVDLALSWFAQRQVASYLVGEVVPGSGKVSGLPA
jgi:phosphoribosylformylglycinamidine cyclo-ligase